MNFFSKKNWRNISAVTLNFHTSKKQNKNKFQPDSNILESLEAGQGNC